MHEAGDKPRPDWKAISERMAGADPVFIAGCNRSGTTALRVALGRHSAFRAREKASPETRVFAHPRRVFRALDPRGTRILRYLLKDEQTAREMLEVLGGQRHWRADGDKIHVLRIFFHFAQQARGCRRLLEKTPAHVFHLDRMFETFPRARVILTIRHPVDVFSSLRKRQKRSDETGRQLRERSWQLFGPKQMAETWPQIARIEQARCSSDPERCFLLRYEDLTADAEGRLQELCAFVGEPFELDALLEDLEVTRDDQGSPTKTSRIAANEKRWQEFVSPEEARELEDRLEPDMKSLGYLRYT